MFLLMFVLTAFMPCVVFFYRRKKIMGIICVLLQISTVVFPIGWVLAMILALIEWVGWVLKDGPKKKRKDRGYYW